MLQRLPIALVQVNATNASEKLQNEIWQIKYFYIEQNKLLNKYITV